MFDMKTITFGYVISNALITVFITVLWSQNRKRYAGLEFWLIDYLLQFIGLGLNSLRGVLPDFVTVILANTMIVGGIFILYIGLERFVGKARPQIHNYLLLGVFVGLMLYFTYVRADISIRTGLISAAILLLMVQCSDLMLRRVETRLKPITRTVGVVFMAYALDALARLVFLVLDPLAPTASWFQAPEEQTLAILVFQMLSIALTFGLILMVTRRLWLDGQEQEAVRRRAETALRESEARLSAVFRSSPVGISLTTFPDGRLTDVNDAFLSLLGYTREEVIGRMVPDLAVWITPEAREQIVATVRERGSVRNVETRFRRKSGELVTLLISVEIIVVSGESHMLTLASDITERKRAEEEIERMARFPSENPHPVLRVGRDGAIQYSNHASAPLLAEWKCQTGQLLPAQWRKLIRSVMKTGMYRTAEVQADGRIFSLTFTPIVKAGYLNIYGLDITERKQVEVNLHHAQESIEAANLELTRTLRWEKRLARTDSLTGVYNRRHFFELAAHEFAVNKRYSTPLSMILFDVDHFKQVNDAFGHQVGDGLLKQVSKIAREQLREADILARYGGDEFAVLLPASKARKSEVVAQRIREKVGAFRIKIGRDRAGVTISAGISECPPGGCTLDQLIRDADRAMYAAKEAGRNHVVIAGPGD